METPPQRVLLMDQVAGVLRRGISSVRWVNELPGEIELCRELQVSRMTLRRALEQLTREQWIAPGGRGRHHRILRKATATPTSTSRTIHLLSPISIPKMSTVSHALFEAFSALVSAAGYRLEYEHHPKLVGNFRPEKLARLDALPDTAGWLLFFSTEAIQRWFVSSGRPAVVVGRVYDSLPISSVYPDTPAAGRHAGVSPTFFSTCRRDAHAL